jgi:hypothetical protein
MRRVRALGTAFALAIILIVHPAAQDQQPPASAATATCDEGHINPDSYRLTTEAQAWNIIRPREPWWEEYGIWKNPREVGDINEGATKLAEEARRIDPRNLLAHSILARQYVVEAIDAQKAEPEWEATIHNGGSIAWTATIYDVDPRSFFVVAFDQKSIRFYQFGQLGSRLRTHFGVPEFPDPAETDFWRTLGGCPPPSVAPHVEIPWSAVRSIEAENYALQLRLADKMTFESDRGSRRTLDKVNVNLHGQVGAFDFRYGMTPYSRRPIFARPGGVAATHYEERVKQMLVKFFDVAGRRS